MCEMNWIKDRFAMSILNNFSNQINNQNQKQKIVTKASKTISMGRNAYKSLNITEVHSCKF